MAKKTAQKINITQNLAEFTASLSFSDIPEPVLDEAKNQIFSVLGSVYAGCGTADGKAVIQTVKETGGTQQAGTFPDGQKTSVSQAVMANCALSMTLDYDDYLFAGHTGHSAVLVPLAWAQAMAVSGKDFLLAQTIANEVEGRLGASVLAGPQNGQLWTHIHLLGGACATGSLLKMSAEEIQNAIGIAFFQPNFGTFAGFMGAGAKVLTAAYTARDGILAALLAKNGLKGTPDILENPKGFLRYFSYVPMPFMFGGLGKTWLSLTLSYKIYPGCAYIDSSIDCIMNMHGKYQLEPREIDKVKVEANFLTVKMNSLSAPFMKGEDSALITLNFSIPYNVAAAIADGELAPKQFLPERVTDKKLWSLAEKVQLVHEPAFTKEITGSTKHLIDFRYILKKGFPFALIPLIAEIELDEIRRMASGFKLSDIRRERGQKSGMEHIDPEKFTMPMGARVTVYFKNGTKIQEEQHIPRGAAGTPADEKRKLVIEKFRREAMSYLGAENVEKAIAVILRLEQCSPEEMKAFAERLMKPQAL